MLALLAALLSPAWGQEDEDIDDLDDDIDIEEPDEPAPPTPKPPPPPDEPDPVEPEDEEDDGLEDFRDPQDETDLLEDEPVNPTSGDTEVIYRKKQTQLAQLEADEELAGWEAYLAQYPNSAFRKRIESRMEELEDKIYELGPTGPGPQVDAGKLEIDFAQAMQLENLNPRTRLQGAFEWGLPDYLNIGADYEHQILRTLSIHGGVRRRYLGFNVEAGARWALVKSTRTNTIVSLIADVRVNTIPAYPGFRPQLAAGKRFGKLDAQLQGGVDLEYRTWLGPDLETTVSAIQPNFVGGASFFYAASDRVGLFAETATYMKPLPADGAFAGGLFRFNVISFGMKFFPGSGAKDKEVNVGATVPYMQQWWQFHYGSIMGQFNYYL
jgi:hypothetical protein